MKKLKKERSIEQMERIARIESMIINSVIIIAVILALIIAIILIAR